MSVHLAILASKTSVQEIAGIELHTWFIGQHLKHTAAGCVENFRGLRKFLALAIEYPIVIVTMAFFQLIVVGIDSCADLGRLAEIERCSFNRGQFSGWNQILIHRCVAAGVDLHNVLQNVAVSLPCEVEV